MSRQNIGAYSATSPPVSGRDAAGALRTSATRCYTAPRFDEVMGSVKARLVAYEDASAGAKSDADENDQIGRKSLPQRVAMLQAASSSRTISQKVEISGAGLKERRAKLLELAEASSSSSRQKKKMSTQSGGNLHGRLSVFEKASDPEAFKKYKVLRDQMYKDKASKRSTSEEQALESGGWR